MPKIGVVLSGCGQIDGSEIHEATLTLLHLDRLGAQVVCFAPDDRQPEVFDHLQRKKTAESRHMLTEAARIARGAVVPLERASALELDALIFPGGQGAAKNLCDWVSRGTSCTVRPDVGRLISEMAAAGKPMGFICIAPVLAAKVLGERGVRLTVGRDAKVAAMFASLGAVHVDCDVEGIVVDETLKVVTTPAYMLGPTIRHVDAGIGRLVERIVRMCEDSMQR